MALRPILHRTTGTVVGLMALLCAMTSFAGPTEPAPVVRVCAMDVPFLPYTHPDGSGQMQVLLALAAKNMNLHMERHIAPRRRCIQELKTGDTDLMIGAYNVERTDIADFPMLANGIDESKALAIVRFTAYRRVGTFVDWNGRNFVNLADGLVGVESGFTYVIDKFKTMGVSYDEGGKTIEQNLEKLVRGRIYVLVAMTQEANKAIAEKFSGQVEALNLPFDQQPMYAMVSKSFRARYPQLTEAYWQEIKTVRAGADYRRYLQQYP
jgi:polar amino acid transport system substrate-binding protein